MPTFIRLTDQKIAKNSRHCCVFDGALRIKLLENHTIDTLVHLGTRAFEKIGGEVVQSVAFVL